MNFDIEVVKRQTLDNPVYYVQYGHARIASILRRRPSGRGPRPWTREAIRVLARTPSSTGRGRLRRAAGVVAGAAAAGPAPPARTTRKVGAHASTASTRNAAW